MPIRLFQFNPTYIPIGGLIMWSIGLYRESSGYEGLDLRCFEVTNTPHKNVKNDVE